MVSRLCNKQELFKLYRKKFYLNFSQFLYRGRSYKIVKDELIGDFKKRKVNEQETVAMDCFIGRYGEFL